ncbi:MAG: sugar kinase [Oscillospiraceae bacterium]|nr:sugar kinase [Oscillospiraceae bacterium]
MEKQFDAIGLGEVMLRLSPAGKERLSRAGLLENKPGGSELNVMAGIAALGLKTAFATKLPVSELRNFITREMRSIGVDDRYVVNDSADGARVGIYFLESGAAPRKPSVVYDRKNSSATRFKAEELPEEIYTNTRLFHTSGITLALSDEICANATAVMKKFKENGALISFDVNYRANLWGEEKAKAAIEAVLPYIDILFISEESCRRMFGRTGGLEEILKEFAATYSLKVVATTKRKINSPSSHDFTSLLYDAEADAFYTEEPYCGIEVVDRIGSGDAYVSGVLYAILSGLSMQKAVEYGNAMAAVKETVAGDLPCTSLKEIDGMIAAHHSTGPQSEMNR